MNKKHYEKSFLEAMELVFENEGGYNNDPDDYGKSTFKGVTQGTYNHYTKQNNLPHKNVENLTDDEIKDFYYKEFWIKSGANKESNSLKSKILFDSAVLLGPENTKKMYLNANKNLDKFLDKREQLHKTVAENPKQKKFLQGWLNRVNKLRNEAKNYRENTNSIIDTIYTKKSSVPYSLQNINLKNQKTLEGFDSDTLAQELETASNKTIAELSNLQKAKIEYYENRIYQSMLKKQNKPEEHAPNITGQTLKDMLEAQKQKLSDFKDKIYMESAIERKFNGKIPEDYKNPELESDKIFTQEDLDAMNASQKSKNAAAIRYQKKTMGIPTKAEAAKAASKKGSGLVHVNGYIRNGVEIGDYYRALPRK